MACGAAREARALGVVVTLLVACGKAPSPQARAADSALGDSTSVVSDTGFVRRVNDYVALRNQLAGKVGPIDETKSQAEIAARAATLAHLISDARKDAVQGAIFTPAASAQFVTLLKRESRVRPDSVKETREDQEDEHRTEGLPDFVPQVNQLFPTSYPLPTFPPALLALLPSLPKEVEYRIIAHHLLLRDIEANLIVDYVPHAVP